MKQSETAIPKHEAPKFDKTDTLAAKKPAVIFNKPDTSIAKEPIKKSEQPT